MQNDLKINNLSKQSQRSTRTIKMIKGYNCMLKKFDSLRVAENSYLNKITVRETIRNYAAKN